MRAKKRSLKSLLTIFVPSVVENFGKRGLDVTNEKVEAARIERSIDVVAVIFLSCCFVSKILVTRNVLIFVGVLLFPFLKVV